MNTRDEKDADVLTLEEYMIEYGFPPAEDVAETADDPEQVAGEIARQTIEIIRQGLREDND